MAAYAALVSLMHIIDQIKHHPFPPISLDKHQVESLTEIVNFLQEFLEGYNSPVADGDEADPLEMRIADAAYAAEDVIESNIVDNIHLASPTSNNGEASSCITFYQDLQQVIEEMDLIKKEVMKTAIEGKAHLRRKVSSTHAGSSKDSVMVGFDDVLLEVMDKLIGGRRGRQVIPIVGMGGIGKTTLARNIFENALIKEHFDICAWTTISQQYSTKEILYEVFSQANRKSRGEMSEEELGLALYKHLSHRRFLIVLDDMWSIEAWEKIQHFFPNNNNNSRIVVTTRLSNLGSQLDNNHSLKLKFLDEASSWNLFSKTVFGEKSCPLELKEIGKKIVENCRALPLSIVVMGGLLKKLEQTKECWESIRENLNSVVNSENDEYCLKILKMSYNHLPAYLKPCFLYMGVFEEDSRIRVSTLIQLWVDEGFVKPRAGKSSETTAREYLKDLVDRNLVLVHRLGSTGNMKYCKIHDLLRDLCLREAEKERFYHIIRQHSHQGMNNKRRIVIPQNTSNEEVIDALQSMSCARSIIGNGRVQLPSNFRLLRILRTFLEYGLHTVDFPVDVLPFVNSRYLAFESFSFSKLLPSLDLLWNLHTLIISDRVAHTAPVGIWKMPQLRLIEFPGRGLFLPDPPSSSIDIDIVVMENLQTLKGIRDFKFDQEVVRRIPNIKKLKVEYEQVEGTESSQDYYCLNNLECLHKLESFSYLISQHKSEYPQMLTFPHSLKKIYLRTSSQWEDVLEKIGSLPFLEKLKLEHGYFGTRKWEIVEGQFPSLKCLRLTRCFGLQCWMIEESYTFPCLEELNLIGFPMLQEIPSEIGEIPTLESISLLNCSATAVESAKRIVEEQMELQGEQLPFHVRAEFRSILEVGEEPPLKSYSRPNFQFIAHFV